MTTTKSLSPAKPYEGRSQHVAVRAALTRAFPDQVATRNEWIQRPSFSVCSDWLNGGDVARVTVRLPRVGRTGDEATVRAVMLDDAAKALTDAGWTVDVCGGDLYVWGPGRPEWVATEKARQAERKARQAEQDAAADELRSRCKAALDALDIATHHARVRDGYGRVTVELPAKVFLDLAAKLGVDA